MDITVDLASYAEITKKSNGKSKYNKEEIDINGKLKLHREKRGIFGGRGILW
jgi:hypothetical protein